MLLYSIDIFLQKEGKRMDVWLTILWIVLGILGAAVAFVILWLLFSTIVGWFVDTKKEYRKRSKFHCFIYNFSLRVAMWLLRVKTHVEGEEKLPKDTRFLMVSNHLSSYDVLATGDALMKYQLGAISKPSNFKIPFFGRLVRRCCFYAIDRENIRNAVKTISLAADVLKTDESSLIVYPEGTRNRSCEGLLPFHNVVFRIAQKANAPIVVVTIRNTQLVHKRTPFRATHIYLKVLDVISAEEAAAMKTDAIGEKVREMMLADEQEWLAKKDTLKL